MKRSLTCVDRDANVDKFWKIDYTEGSTEWTFSFGRNGTAGTTKTKTFPSAGAAAKAAAKVLNEKLSAGYVDVAGTNLTILNATSPAPVVARAFQPMLFDKIEPVYRAGVDYAEALLALLAPYIASNEWAVEEKVNGDRIALIGKDGKVTVVGKSGQASKSSALFADRRRAPQLARLLTMCGDFILDGELVAGKLWLFDLPRLVCGSVTFDGSEEFYKRRAALERIVAAWNPDQRLFGLLPCAQGTEAKQALLDRTRAELCEGVMLKKIDAPYKCGPRRGTGGFKAKNWKSASLIVHEVNVDGKCNAILAAWKGKKKVIVGGCSLNGKGNVQVGDIIEVKYLYWDKEALVQTDCLGVRTDVDESECVFEQLVGTNKGVLA